MNVVAKRWLSDGRGVALLEEHSRGFDMYLNRLPWAPAKVDWTQMPASTTFYLGPPFYEDHARRLLEWFRSTTIGKHTHIAVWYSIYSGGIVVPAVDAVLSLDELYAYAPGVRYAFGIDAQQSAPRYEDLLQYGDGDILVAVPAPA